MFSNLPWSGDTVIKGWFKKKNKSEQPFKAYLPTTILIIFFKFSAFPIVEPSMKKAWCSFKVERCNEKYSIFSLFRIVSSLDSLQFREIWCFCFLTWAVGWVERPWPWLGLIDGKADSFGKGIICKKNPKLIGKRTSSRGKGENLMTNE